MLSSIPPRICMSCPNLYANLTVQYNKLSHNVSFVFFFINH